MDRQTLGHKDKSKNPSGMCFCGQPLHYTDPYAQSLVEELVKQHGTHIKIQIGSRAWLVQRHYIALHGIKATDLPYLGFEEVRTQT